MLAPAAAGHGVLAPPTATAGSTQRFELTVPNDRPDADIVAVALELPEGLMIETAEASQPRWGVSWGDDVVTWQGGPIERGSAETFVFTARMPPEVGVTELALVETYDDGAAAPFPVGVSVVGAPGASGGSSDALAAAALVAAVLALLAATAALAIALRSRRPLQP